MKTKLICWFDNKVLEHCKDFLIKNQIMPICADAGIAYGINRKIIGLICVYDKVIWEYSFKNNDKYVYLDEILSVPNDSKGNKRVWEVKDNTIYGETSTETIQQLIDAGCKSITYTCYGWHLFRIFGLNIRMPFTTQLNTWEYLERKYNCFEMEDVDNPIQRLRDGKWRYNFDDEWFEKYDNEKLFTFCWIMLDQVKSFKKLIQWCIAHNKTIGLVAPDKHKDNPEWVKKHLELFINAYKEVVK